LSFREPLTEKPMDFSALRAYLASRPGAVEDFPFGPFTLVFKVGGRMFALVFIGEDPLRLNLKCDPPKAEILREVYPAVLPGYHMNKRHWNTVVLDGSLPEADLHSMIDESHALVVQGLPRSRRPGAEG
jgi:predicted DNA-binding protein (MmcQ/YjbR family)